jgi:metal-responsive CopG/Arc/MetJ family transcriptional regulator
MGEEKIFKERKNIVSDERKMTSYISIKLPAELIEIIDNKIVGRLGYRSRAEFIKELIRKELETRGLISKERA